ncbi:hypothetical protein JCM10449v2_003238 [Rhodotorula kratochvilovae]
MPRNLRGSTRSHTQAAKTPAPFERLPVELVSHILDFVGSHEDSAAAQARRSTLSSLSLVCKSLRRLAQPLLWRTVTVGTPFHVDALCETVYNRTLAQHTTTLVAERSLAPLDAFNLIEDDCLDLLLADDVVEVLQLLPYVKRVFLFEFSAFETLDMLWDDRFDLDFSGSGPFQGLDALLFGDVDAVVKRLGSPIAHALRELALPPNLEITRDDVERWSKQNYVPALSLPFLDQLELLELDNPALFPGRFDNSEPLPPDNTLYSTSTPILLDLPFLCEPYDRYLTLRFAKHLYFAPSSAGDPSSALKVILAHQILKAVFLPADYASAHPLKARAVTTICTEAGVDLV